MSLLLTILTYILIAFLVLVAGVIGLVACSGFQADRDNCIWREKLAQTVCPNCRTLYGVEVIAAAFQAREDCWAAWQAEHPGVRTRRRISLEVTCPACEDKTTYAPYRKLSAREQMKQLQWKAWEEEQQAERRERQRQSTDLAYCYGDTRCEACGQRLVAWADSLLGVCGYCGFELPQDVES